MKIPTKSKSNPWFVVGSHHLLPRSRTGILPGLRKLLLLSSPAAMAGGLLIGVVVAGMRPAAAFTPPGPNIALHKPYTLSTPPSYGACTDSGDATQLTDGEYTAGFFWTEKTTVAWYHDVGVGVTIDLGKVEPIAGVSYSTAAGAFAGVSWPTTLMILVSHDKKMWTYIGDLTQMTDKQDGPPRGRVGEVENFQGPPSLLAQADQGPPRAAGLVTYRFATDELKASGRYVQLIIEQLPFTCVDEIEVYQGPPSLLAQANQGPKNSDPLEFYRRLRTLKAMMGRLRTDLMATREAINAAKLSADEKGRLLAQAGQLGADVENLTLESVPDGFKAILPLNELHARIYALNAPLLRARGLRVLTPWMANRWDTLQPTEAPERLPNRTPSLLVQMMRNEYRAEAFNLTNPVDKELRLTVSLTGLPGGTNPAYISPREVLFTDSLAFESPDQKPIAAALPPAPVGDGGFEITVPAGMTRQVWLSFHPTTVKPGIYHGNVRIRGAATGKELVLPLTLQLYPFTFPTQVSIAIGGWDYLDGAGLYDAAHTPQKEFIRTLREHFVNTPWGTPWGATPGNPQFDADGQLIGTPNFASWDAWIAKWPGARTYAVALSYGNSFFGEKMGTPRFNRMVGAWITAWVAHIKEQGLKPGQLLLLPLDEPQTPEQDEIILRWTKALRAAQPEVVLWEDPAHVDPSKANQEMMSSCTILCIGHEHWYNRLQSYRDYFIAQQKAGRELAFYGCSGGKQMDPISYFRAQFWSAIKYHARGSFYWAFGSDGLTGNSWNPYLADNNGTSPLFIGPEGTTDAKHIEAIREGAEDYEYFQMLSKRVAELEAKGVKSPLITEVRDFMKKGTDEALADAASDNLEWNQLLKLKLKWDQPRDRSRMDRVRVKVLDLLVKLSKL